MSKIRDYASALYVADILLNTAYINQDGSISGIAKLTNKLKDDAYNVLKEFCELNDQDGEIE